MVSNHRLSVIPGTGELRNFLCHNTIDSLEKASEGARLFLSCGHNRNLLLHRNMMYKYVAYIMLLLARHRPLLVKHIPAHTNTPYLQPLVTRSKMGDIPHLITALSYPTRTMLDWIKSCLTKEPDTEDSLIQICNINETEMRPLVKAMLHWLDKPALKAFSSLDFSFRLPRMATDRTITPVASSVLDMSGQDWRSIALRCSSEISRMLCEEKEMPPISLSVLGARMKYLREAEGMTQTQLSKAVGVTTVACSRMESGGSISADVLFRFILWWSRSVNIDVLFNNHLWELSRFDPGQLYKQVHLSSVVKRKLDLLRNTTEQDIQAISNTLENNLQELYESINTAISSVIAYTDQLPTPKGPGLERL